MESKEQVVTQPGAGSRELGVDPQPVHARVEITVSHFGGKESSPSLAIHKTVSASVTGQVQSDVLAEAVGAALAELKGKP